MWHYTSSSSFRQGVGGAYLREALQPSAETHRITHLPPLTLTEKPSQRFTKNLFVWATGPLESRDDDLQPWKTRSRWRARRGALIHTQSGPPGYCKCPHLSGSPRSEMAWEGQHSSGFKKRKHYLCFVSFLVITAGVGVEQVRCYCGVKWVGGGLQLQLFWILGDLLESSLLRNYCVWQPG